jgi:hypothetical protein
MIKRKVISSSNLPPRSPLSLTLWAFYAADYYEIPGFVQGIWFSLLGLLWIVYFIELFTTDPVKIDGLLEREGK